MKPSDDWAGQLHASYWRSAAADWLPETQSEQHSQAMRAAIVRDFGFLPTSHWPHDPSQNYADEAAAGKNALGAAVDESGEAVDRDLYGAQKAAGGRLSVFEGRLARNCIRLWSNPGDLVLDPFAGRGIRLRAAVDLGRRYVGFDTSPEAVAACRSAVEGQLFKPDAVVHECSSLWLDRHVAPGSADMVFTCPPYYSSEFYGDNGDGVEACPTYSAFVEELAAIAMSAGEALKPDRFMVFVLRGFFGHGVLYDTPAHLAAALARAGWFLHDQIAKKMGTTRERFHQDVVKLRRTAQTHEAVLVFKRWSGRKSPAAYREATLEKNAKRKEREEALRERRRELLAYHRVSPAEIAPVVPQDEV